MSTRAPYTRPRRIVRDRTASERVAFAAALCDVVADPSSEITGIHLVSTTAETAEAVEEVAMQRGLATRGEALRDGPAGPRRSVTIRAEWPHPERRSA